MSNPSTDLAAERARQEAAITDFWQWWNSYGAEVLDNMFTAQLNPQANPQNADDPLATLSGLGNTPFIDVQKEVGGRIAAINERLIWGFEPGAPYSRHLLTVSAAGDPELRPAARRWLEAAPDDNEIWSFTDLRQADPDLKLSLGEIADALKTNGALPADAPAEIDPAEAKVQVGSGHGAVDVRLYHPLFAALAELPEGDRLVTQLGFTMLQLAIGEEDFGLWLRGFAFAGIEPEGAISLKELAKHINELAEACPEWLTIEAEANGQPVRVATRAPITQLVSPTHTQHIAVQLMLPEVDEQGLPTESAKEQLGAYNEAAIAALGEDGVFVASEHSDGMALNHYFVDPASEAESRLREVAEQWTGGEHAVDAAYDPAWQRVGHLRV